MNWSNKPNPEANRSAKDATESHRTPRRFPWNPFSGKLKPTWFGPVWRKWRKSEKRSSRSSSKEEVAAASPELPREIIREILIRLPIKSIGRSRCVSKLFRSLSSDPGFAKGHLDLTVPPVHRKLIVSSHETYSLDSYSIGGGGGSEVTLDLIASNLKDGEPFRRRWVMIFGSSDGLVCISPDDDVVFLYNPTTRESKRLPETVLPSIYEGFQSHGFGFDHLTNDYKVVKLVADKNKNLLYATVYSLKADSWRWICDLNYQSINRSRLGVNLNGVIHWVVFTRLQQGNNHKQRVILAFDIVTEEFREMIFPDVEEVGDCPNSVVGNLNGRLCVFNRSYGLRDDIWVMNEYGVASSWTRIRISLLYKWMKPLCSTRNSEEVLLALDGDMVLYNFETHAWRKLEIQGVNLRAGFDVMVLTTEENTLIISDNLENRAGAQIVIKPYLII